MPTLYVGNIQRLTVNDPASPLLLYAGRHAMLQVSPEPEGAAPYPLFF